MARLALLHLSAISLAVLPRALCDTIFTNPNTAPSGVDPDLSNNLIYNVGDKLNITWTTDQTADVNLALWQSSFGNTRKTPGFQYLPDSKAIPADSSPYTWTVGINGMDDQPNFDLLLSNVFFLALYVNGQTSPLVDSVLFNISNATVGPDGNRRHTSTSAHRTATLTSKTSTASSSGTASASATNSSSGGSSNSVALGVGLGLGLGIPFILAIVGGLWLLSRRRRAAAAGSSVEPKHELGAYATNSTYAKVASDPNDYIPQHTHHPPTPPVELPSTSQPQELHGS